MTYLVLLKKKNNYDIFSQIQNKIKSKLKGIPFNKKCKKIHDNLTDTQGQSNDIEFRIDMDKIEAT